MSLFVFVILSVCHQDHSDIYMKVLGVETVDAFLTG